MMVADDGFDTVTAISALESTASLFSSTLQLASLTFQFIPGMAGVAGVLGGVSSGFDNASKVLDGIDKIRALCDEVMEIYDQHPDPAANPQAAGALITKAFTLKESGRYSDALAVSDDLAGRFGADTDPSVAGLVRTARINTTWLLNQLQRYEEAITRCGEVVDRYGTDPDPAVVVAVLSARLNKMQALGTLQRNDEALSCFDEIVSICAGFDSGGAQGLEVRVRQDQVSALSMKSLILLGQGKADAALAVSDEIAERFGADQHPEIQAQCLVAKLPVLYQSERWQEAIDVYDQVLARYAKNRPLREMALNAGYNKVGLLLQLRRFKDAVRACDDVQWKFRKDPAARIATTALEAEGYRGLGQYKKALRACGKVVDLVGSDSDVVSRRWLAATLAVKAQTLWALRPGDEALSGWADVDRRFGDDPDLTLRREVARALLEKGAALEQSGRPDELAATLDTIVARYGEDPDPMLTVISARARSGAAKLRS
jgi:tetratricopeptide (TPR) repeat protein